MAKKSTIPNSTEEFLEFFATEITRLEEEVARVDTMQKKLADFTAKFADNPAARGAAHYYIESIKNELQASSQKQSLIRDISALRKAVLDYSLRISNGEGDETFAALQKKLADLVTTMRAAEALQKTVVVVDNDVDLDKEIERRLTENK